MRKELCDKICHMVEADIDELVAKGSLEPCDYGPLGEAVDIVKDIYKIKEYAMEEEMPEESMRSYGMSGRVPRYDMRMSAENRGGSQDGSYGYSQNSYDNMNGSQYNPNRSSVTGRYTSRDGASYHDMDGSMRKDLEELLTTAKNDHERMLIMRVLGKIDQ